MPKNKKRHASDGEDEVISPVVKKAKVKTPTKASSPSKPTPPLSKSTEKKSTEKKNTDAEGNEFWELGNKRRIGTSSFKNTLLVNIREYYEQDGQFKPGKKGISLTVDQYRALVQAIPQLNESLRKSGHEIADTVASTATSTDGGARLTASSPPPPTSTSSKKKTSAKREKVRKANIEVTSDEDDSE
ncbi:transcriptional Coactivator p15-domain-containing protein [Schizothecium vesticola]|uniref:Transcriptional Coactivator p15-domain-containing protein n=1 Tax=Schizothecium vesticola TaxID=314040 RepID=A0AA40EKZ6_9PEZI|nr:transcriptional Coactivator p15-domain-containing protein [Schizothecium vesticola]